MLGNLSKHEGHLSVCESFDLRSFDFVAAFSIPSKGSMTKENYPVLFTLYLVGQFDSAKEKLKSKIENVVTEVYYKTNSDGRLIVNFKNQQ